MAKRPSGKQPYAIVGAYGKPLALAGLWERWKEPGSGQAVQTFTIITGPPNELVAPIHNRMPVILPPAAWQLWLGEEKADADELLGLLRPLPAELMRAYPVGVRVGNVRNNDPELLTQKLHSRPATWDRRCRAPGLDQVIPPRRPDSAAPVGAGRPLADPR